MRKGVHVRAARAPLTLGAEEDAKTFGRGALIVTTGGQEMAPAKVTEFVNEMLAEVNVSVTPVPLGLVPGAPDLGSGSYPVLEEPKVLLAIGGRVSAYEAGEVWHDLDTRVGLGVATVDKDRLAGMDLSGFTHVVLVSGATSGMSEGAEDALERWVRGGGVLIATKRSALWAAETMLSKGDAREHAHKDENGPGPGAGAGPAAGPAAGEDGSLTYADYEGLRAQQRVAGTIFEVNVDSTHPIAFGMRDRVAVFRNFEEVLPESRDPFATPVRYSKDPLLSGFASPENVAKFSETPAIRVERVGGGTVIAMIDNPVFRGVWYGTRPFVVNAVFFGGIVERTGPIDTRTEEEEAAYDHGHAHNR